MPKLIDTAKFVYPKQHSVGNAARRLQKKRNFNVEKYPAKRPIYKISSIEVEIWRLSERCILGIHAR